MMAIGVSGLFVDSLKKCYVVWKRQQLSTWMNLTHADGKDAKRKDYGELGLGSSLGHFWDFF